MYVWFCHYFNCTNGAACRFQLNHPKLWWPVGYGEAYLYDIRVDARNAQMNSSLVQKTGIRHVELIQYDTNAGNVTGKTFYFRINGVPMFIKGANWIPTDSFPTRTKTSTVRHLLESARAANMNMVRKLHPLVFIVYSYCFAADTCVGRW